MEKLTYSRMLTLKDISLRNVTTLLWTEPHILASLDESRVEYKVEHNIKVLEIPATLVEQIKFLVKPIGTDIRNWKNFHEEYLEIGNINILSFVQQLCWTWSVGMVDYAKTAENIIHSEMFDTHKLYKLACLYCLEEYIQVLWEKLPIESKKCYYQEEEVPWNLKKPQLEYFWPYIIKGEETRLMNTSYFFESGMSFNQNLFHISVFTCNKAAAHYFFQKLPSCIRKDVLSRAIKDASNRVSIAAEFRRRMYRRNKYFSERIKTDIFIYLLSLMKAKQQMVILRDPFLRNLLNFLEWPWQDLFLNIADLTWSSLDKDNYVYALIVISRKIQNGYYFSNIFQEFLLRGSSVFLKELVKLESQCPLILWDFFDHDSETIKVILRTLDSESRKKLIVSESVLKYFVASFQENRPQSVQLCLRETNFSEEDKKELKKAFFAYLNNNHTLSESRYMSMLKQFLQFLDESHVKLPSKRKFEKGLSEY